MLAHVRHEDFVMANLALYSYAAVDPSWNRRVDCVLRHQHPLFDGGPQTKAFDHPASHQAIEVMFSRE